MKQLNISKDIVPISEFKSSLSKWLKNIQNTWHPLVITQNGRPASVLLSPSEYDELVYKRDFLDSVKRGISDAESGNIYSTKELKEELDKRRQRGTKWRSDGRKKLWIDYLTSKISFRETVPNVQRDLYITWFKEEKEYLKIIE